MALIPDETIEQILDRVDIVELAARYMTLKRTGVNNMGCCPFHNEKTPSFNVNSSRQRYHCFGCGADGTLSLCSCSLKVWVFVMPASV